MVVREEEVGTEEAVAVEREEERSKERIILVDIMPSTIGIYIS